MFFGILKAKNDNNVILIYVIAVFSSKALVDFTIKYIVTLHKKTMIFSTLCHFAQKCLKAAVFTIFRVILGIYGIIAALFQ